MQWDRDGQPIDMLDWVFKVGDADYRTVAHTDIDQVEIRTTWVGVAQGFDADSRPIIFETGIYDSGKLIRTRGYASEAEALWGHSDECAAIKQDHH